MIEGTFERPPDAFFESMSGFTTTGATPLAGVEPHPDAILLRRSTMQWLGGVRIVVLVVAIAPATGLATQRIFYRGVHNPRAPHTRVLAPLDRLKHECQRAKQIAAAPQRGTALGVAPLVRAPR